MIKEILLASLQASLKIQRLGLFMDTPFVELLLVLLERRDPFCTPPDIQMHVSASFLASMRLLQGKGPGGT